MELPTFTGIWTTKRVIHKIEDVRLPVPVPADILLMTVACFAIWDGFWWAVAGAEPFGPVGRHNSLLVLTAVWLILPPFLAARIAGQPNREGKNAIQATASRARYLIRPETLDGYVSRRHIRVWLKARDARTRMTALRPSIPGNLTRRPAVPGLQLRDRATRCRRYARSLAGTGRHSARTCLRKTRAWPRRWAAAGYHTVRGGLHRIAELRHLRLHLVKVTNKKENDEDTGTG